MSASGCATRQHHGNKPASRLCGTLALEATGPRKTKRAPAHVGESKPLTVQKTSATAEGGSKKGSFYKPLPNESRRDGFDYRQIALKANAAIYEQRWIGCAEPSVYYEVIRIRQREDFQICGRCVPPAAVYPRSEAWGVDGFTFADKDAAFAKLRELA